jgi:2-hydroxychromene-2-carboxylate isomerase
MKIVWYFDFISPFAWLQWPKIEALAATRELTLRPILFGALLSHMEQKGPAEIPRKREFTYRYALWRARIAGSTLRFPPAHPFNPLPALRLCIAAGTTVAAIDTIFRWIWEAGQLADSLATVAPLAAKLGIEDAQTAMSDPSVKATLRANYEAALAEGVFGVPMLSIDGELFWGEDAHDFAMAYLDDPSMLGEPEMARLGALPIGLSRI